ncbi:alkyl hydroperoxide reductase subunit c thiol specific antioxidant, partial [Colletotrichum incanum]
LGNTLVNPVDDFAIMSFTQELASWMSPTKLDLGSLPKVGDFAPSTDLLKFPRADGKAAVVVFLRHCGCPFAEKSFIVLREAASKNPNVAFIAVSHSSESHTKKWLSEVGGPGDKNPVEVIFNEERDVYAKWGLGTSSFMHVLSPSALSNVFKLSREEGIANRPTESGSRWQTSGAWAVGENGKVTWGGPAQTASEIPNVDEALSSLH